MSQEILVVDDERDISELLAGVLEDEGYSVRMAHDGQSAIEEVNKRVPGLVLLDIWLGDSSFDGMKALKFIKNTYKELQVIMMSGHGTVATAVEAMKMGAFDFIEKPFKTDHLMIIVKRCLRMQHLTRGNKESRHRELEYVALGQSVRIQKLKQEIDKLANSNARVVLHGPTGSGRKAFARLVHLSAERKSAPFIICNTLNLTNDNCSEILLGKETLDGKTVIGLLERSHLGTLFVDEIKNLPSKAQEILTDFLRMGSFIRVNGETQVAVTNKVICATICSHADMVSKNIIDNDLYNLLRVIGLEIPALSSRNEDLGEILQVMNKITAEAYSLKSLKFTKDAVDALQVYGWPGNLKQLKNVVEWLFINHSQSGQSVTSAMLPLELTKTSFHERRKENDLVDMPIKQAREQFEKEYLKKQLIKFGGNISKISKHIGMERSALHRKLKTLMQEKAE